jgi:GMP synthase PP-ATPase subunit
MDASVVTLPCRREIGNRLVTVSIENGLMRKGEPECVWKLSARLKVPVRIVAAKADFFQVLSI